MGSTGSTGSVDTTSAEHQPADGYGVVPFGRRWMPVKWAPEAGAGAYRGLRDDDRAAPDGTPKTFATREEAARFTWAARRAASDLLRATRDVEESDDPPARRSAAKAPKRAKPTKAGGREPRQTPHGTNRPDADFPAPPSIPPFMADSSPDSILVPVLTPRPTPRSARAMTPTVVAVVPILTPEAATVHPERAGGKARAGARADGHRKTRTHAQASA